MSTRQPSARYPKHVVQPVLAWWQRRAWREYLQTRLWRRCRRRYTLHLSAHGPLGATDQARRQVLVNPIGLAFPSDPAERLLVRHAPNDPDTWQQELTIDLIEHECGHVRFSGAKPDGLLGWLWNALEDARQERLMATVVAEDGTRFERLGDAAWLACTPTGDLLHWCLLWRWEAAHPPGSPQATVSRMDFGRGDWQLWELAIRPLVERAWTVASSDAVIPIAAEILTLLGRDPADTAPDLGWCVTNGRRADAPDAIPLMGDRSQDADLPPRPTGSGVGTGAVLQEGEAEPAAVLAEVDVAARELARTLRPPAPMARPVPHASRGALQVERAMVRSPRPFEHPQLPAPDRGLALLVLADESGSMGDGAVAGSRAWGAIRATMLLDRACELAQVPLQIWGFEDGDGPHVIRSWSESWNDEAARRRIAGICGGGGTLLTPVFRAAIAALQGRPEPLRWLILTLDGELADDDAAQVRALVPVARRLRIHVQPVFLGEDAAAVATVRALFGSCLEAPTPAGLASRLGAWIRALR